MIGAHGGSVEIIDNDDGKGCRVRIKLPLTERPPAGYETV
jgi:hypothetical protein